MKKLLTMLTLAVCLCLIVGMALAEEPEKHKAGDYEYVVLEDGTAEITRYRGNAKTLEIPDVIGGLRITSIGECAFELCFDLTSVIIPDSVTNIAVNPFIACSYLSSIHVSPDHPAFATIDGILFSKADKRLICYPEAKKAKHYEIPKGIAEIGNSAFYTCENLSSITIPDSVISIDDNAFYRCSNLKAVVIPNSVISIGKNAFIRCIHMTSITIPNSVISIGDMAFCGCSSLASVDILDGVTSIGDGAFYLCYKLTSISIPKSVASIGGASFCSCSGLTSITIPASVTYIGINAFYDCSNLTLTVSRDSYAAQYCKDNNLSYQYPDSLDWLTN